MPKCNTVLQSENDLFEPEIQPSSYRNCEFWGVDRTLQDITGLKIPMGGIPTLLCGDFRQILPVVKNGTRANIVNSSLKRSHLWGQINIMKLDTNMRAHLSGDVAALAEDLIGTIRFRVALSISPLTISNKTLFCHDGKQITRSDVQIHWGGPLHSMFHACDVLCSSIANTGNYIFWHLTNVR